MMKTMNPHQKRDKGHVSTKRQQMLKKKKKYVNRKEIAFVNGGSREDPLNLNSIPLQQCSPASSPSPHSRRDKPALIPVIKVIPTDPLNLDAKVPEDEYKQMIRDQYAKINSKSRKTRHRNRKNDGHDSAPEDGHEVEGNRPRSLSLGSKTTIDPVVSPVNATRSPRKRTRTVSEGASCSESGDEAAPTWIKRFKRRIAWRCQEQKRPMPQAEPSQEEPPKPPARQLPARAKFQYGNFHRYYAYRNFGLLDDPRMSIIAHYRNDFHRKDVLDIGCNAGHVTLAIAKDFRPNRIVGIDIDENLITLARKNLQHRIAATKSEDPAGFPKAAKLTFGPLVPPRIDGADGERAMQFPYNVFFSQGNIVLDTDEQVARQRPEYDTVVALSVTKWIHLNWGDDGLKRAFKRIYNMLRPGGCFILEPQNLASYKRRKNVTERIRYNYDNITLKPDYFKDYLQYEIGFTECRFLGDSENHAKGFARPIFAFWKRPQLEEPMI